MRLSLLHCFYRVGLALAVVTAVLSAGVVQAEAAVANLNVEGLQLATSQAAPGARLLAKVIVSNDGGSNATSTTLKMWFSYSATGAMPDSKADLLSSNSLGTIAPGKTLTYSTTVTLPKEPKPGTYRIFAYVATTATEHTLANNKRAAMLTLKAASSAQPGPSSPPNVPSGSPSGSCSAHESFFDSVLTRNLASFDGLAAEGDGAAYYNFSYVLEGTLAMYEGTGELKYLEQVLEWAETMMSKATIVDSKGKRSWAGTAASPHTSTRVAQQLEDFQGSTALARLARRILTEPALRQRYGVRADRVYKFVKGHIVDKHLGQNPSWPQMAAHDESRDYSDKLALLVRILLDLHEVDGNTSYLNLARDLLSSFEERLSPYRDGSLIWDRGGPDGTYDTAHANRHPYMVVDAYEAGVVITRRALDGLANLFTEVIWDQSLSSPRFTNYIDGSNGAYRNRGAWANGLISSGWITLGAHDPVAQRVAEATLAAAKAGIRNPSLEYMRSAAGHISLAGFVTRNLRIANRCH